MPAFHQQIFIGIGVGIGVAVLMVTVIVLCGTAIFLFHCGIFTATDCSSYCTQVYQIDNY